MVKDHADSESGNPLPPVHSLLFSTIFVFFNLHIQTKLL